MRRPVLVAVLLALAVSPALAVRPLTWTEPPSGLRQGELDGVAVTSRGALFMAPEIGRVPASGDAGAPAYIWCMAADRAGNVYLGTGPEGWILRIDSSGRQRPYYRVDEPMVTALAVLPGGDLLAGTAPEGKIYRIGPGADGRLWSETGERYVWDLSVGPGGSIHAATGEKGIVYTLDGGGGAAALFDSAEAHITALAPLSDGSVLAGGAGKGIIYRIDPEGHALVLHDDLLPEVSDLAVMEDGSVLATLLAPPVMAPRRPAVRIQLPDGASVGAASDQVEGLDERPGSTMEGIIEGLPARPDGRSQEVLGRVVRIDSRDAVTEIWRSATETPFALDTDSSGRAVFGTGEPARLYRIEGDDEVALLGTLREAQVTGLLRRGTGFLLATSNPAASYRLRWDADQPGVFLSRPFDAGGPARWGSIRWNSADLPGYVELYTRTGNSTKPDDTWSGWSPALTDPSGSAIDNPDGRFLQWRVRMAASGASDSSISGVSVSYVPHNRPPAMEEFRLQAPAASVRERAEFRWRWRDADRDPVRIRIQYRSPGRGPWAEAGSIDLATGSDPEQDTADPSGWRTAGFTWDTGNVPEARYEIRARISDQPGNHPGEGLSRTAHGDMELRVDRTPPEIAVNSGENGERAVRVTDALSRIDRLEVLVSGELAFLARPVDGVCDSPRESFTIPAGSLPRGEAWSLRAVDEAGNITERAGGGDPPSG